jgi:hypothetical protein
MMIFHDSAHFLGCSADFDQAHSYDYIWRLGSVGMCGSLTPPSAHGLSSSWMSALSLGWAESLGVEGEHHSEPSYRGLSHICFLCGCSSSTESHMFKATVNGEKIVTLKPGGMNLVWLHTPVISALGRLRQEDCKFKANLGYIVRPCLKTKHQESWFI